MDTLFAKTSFFTIFKKNNEIFSQFSKETTQFFHNFQKKRRNFSQLVWYRTPSQFWEKNAENPIKINIPDYGQFIFQMKNVKYKYNLVNKTHVTIMMNCCAFT